MLFVNSTVTVLDDNWHPLLGATVQFLRSRGCSYAPSGANARIRLSYVTDHNGVAFFPNAPSGRWGMNVTHPNFVSTIHTSTPLTGNTVPNFIRRPTDVGTIQNVPFTFAERSDHLRGFDWVNPLPEVIDEDTGIPAPVFVRSVFGWRNRNEWTFGWHQGIDLVYEHDDGAEFSARKDILSASPGRVVLVYENTNWAGYGVVIRFDDWDNSDHFFVEYQHMYSSPATDGRNLHRNHNYLVTKGQPIGRVGNTGESDNYHLHLGVFRNNTYRFIRNRTHSMDPRAFFAPDFALPWPHMYIQQ